MRNEIFRTMFTNFKESTQQIITLTEFKYAISIILNNISYDTMFNFIKFLYTDECEITGDNVVSLFECCNHYGEKV